MEITKFEIDNRFHVSLTIRKYLQYMYAMNMWEVVGRRGLMDRASASYPHGVKGLGFKPPWRQKL